MADYGQDMVTQFKPDHDNTRMLRDAFSRFMSGITIVTAASDQGPVGITASSFSSLSHLILLWFFGLQQLNHGVLNFFKKPSIFRYIFFRQIRKISVIIS